MSVYCLEDWGSVIELWVHHEERELRITVPTGVLQRSVTKRRQYIS